MSEFKGTDVESNGVWTTKALGEDKGLSLGKSGVVKEKSTKPAAIIANAQEMITVLNFQYFTNCRVYHF